MMTGPGETWSLPRSPACLGEVAVVLACVPEAMGCGLGAGAPREKKECLGTAVKLCGLVMGEMFASVACIPHILNTIPT